MNRIAKNARTWLTVGLTGFGVACSGAHEVAAPVDVAQTSEKLQWQLVDREYPYSLGEDATVCAEWEARSLKGEVVAVEREWYPMQVMNRHLANVGTPEAVAHVGEATRDALSELGIYEIETCDQAREYSRLTDSQLGLLAVEELDPTWEAAEEIVYEDLPSAEDPFVEKIINGSPFDHASTVGIQTTGGNCTGTLISKFAMITAAHCVPTTGFIALNAWIQTEGQPQKCISSPGGASCPALGPATVYAQRHPNYDGTQPFDQAVVIINPGWYAPANVSSRWTRFAANWGLPLIAGLQGDPIRIDGYGVKNPEKEGVGLGRRGNSTHTIATVNPAGTVFSIVRPTETSSGACGGDSGSGPYNTTLLGSNLTMGVASQNPVQVPGGSKCVAVGASTFYSIPDSGWISNVVTFFGGSCQVLTHQASGTPFMKCF